MARLVFLGSPSLAVPSLDSLVRAGHDVRAVITRPESRRGRRESPRPTPVAAAAARHGIPVEFDLAAIARFKPELGVVVAYGRIIPAAVLESVPMVNVHFSLLPRWRGAAPIERAILAGDERTGVCLMALDAGLDTGGVYACTETEIAPDETATALGERLAAMGAELLVERLRTGLGVPSPQEGAASYAAKVTPAELRLDFSRPAVELARVVRVGRAWTTFRHGRLLVHSASVDRSRAAGCAPGTIEGERVATGEGFLVPEIVQAEGRTRQSFAEWLRGARLEPGERLGTEHPLGDSLG